MRVGLADGAVLNTDAAWRIIDGRAILVSLRERKLHLLNEVGTRIWEHIQDEKTVGEIADMVAEEYEVSREDARADVHTFVATLVKEKICSVEQPRTSHRAGNSTESPDVRAT